MNFDFVGVDFPCTKYYVNEIKGVLESMALFSLLEDEVGLGVVDTPQELSFMESQSFF